MNLAEPESIIVRDATYILSDNFFLLQFEPVLLTLVEFRVRV